MAVKVEGVVHATVQHLVEHDVHGLQLGQQVARDLARMALCKLLCHSGFGDLINQHIPQRGVPGDDADVGAVAFVAGAAVGQAVEGDR